MFVFFDIETTGTDIVFDQVLEFAAVLTDAHLQEIDRFNARCQLLPWIVPSPKALCITNISPSQLNDSSLPTLFEMMSSVRKKLEAWSPAIFMGYNSLRFDEPILQRAFWQTLNPPYLTVTNGNSRGDLLSLVRAVSHFAPNVLEWPEKEGGGISFRLDQIAPSNGFDHSRAHEALADVEATIFIANKIATRAPELWSAATTRVTKAVTSEILSYGDPVLVFEHFGGKASAWFGQRIDADGKKTAAASVAKLSHDWRAAALDARQTVGKIPSQSPKQIRQVALNKSPLVFTEAEASELFGLALDFDQRSQSEFLKSERSFTAILVDALRANAEPWPKGDELEQMIFEGFASREDVVRMESFQAATWQERVQLAPAFEDDRFRRLAMRILYVSARELLPSEVLLRMERAVETRLLATGRPVHPWRSISDAMQEFSDCNEDLISGNGLVAELKEWIGTLATS